MKNKFGVIFISGLVIGVYCLVAVIKGIFGTTEWFGSPMSILLGILLWVIWTMVAAVWVVFLLKDTYVSLNPQEKQVADTIIKNVAHETIKELKQRKDKVGWTARFVSKVTQV